MMKSDKDRKYITLLGIIALLTVILGYGGLWRVLSSDPYGEIKLEACRIVDIAQIWYIRPEKYGGGERSFDGLDFHSLGLPSKSSSYEYKSQKAIFRLENIRRYTFDLVITAPEGAVLECRGLTFDTKPEFKIIPSDDAREPGESNKKAD